MLSKKEVKETLYNSLKELGVTENAIELYITSLTIGPATISTLSTELNINRPNVYKIIADLEQHGLAKFSERKKYSHTFMVQPPTIIKELLNKKVKDLENDNQKIFTAMPDLLAMYRQGELPTSIKIYEGREQFMKIFFELLDEAKDTIEYLGSAEDLISGFIGWANEERWIKKRLKNNIFIKSLIFESNDANKLKTDDLKQLRETRLLKNLKPFPTSFHISANKVIIWQVKTPLALVIEDEYMVQMFRAMFYAFWEQNS